MRCEVRAYISQTHPGLGGHSFLLLTIIYSVKQKTAKYQQYWNFAGDLHKHRRRLDLPLMVDL